MKSYLCVTDNIPQLSIYIFRLQQRKVHHHFNSYEVLGHIRKKLGIIERDKDNDFSNELIKIIFVIL